MRMIQHRSGIGDPADTDVELLGRLPAVGGLLARAALAAYRRPDATTPLPDRQVKVSGVGQDVSRLARYARVCAFTLRDRVPATWLHVLTFPLQMHLMTARDFPFAAVGMVHVANRMTQHRPVEVSEVLTLSVRADHVRPHRAGVMVDLIGQAMVGREVVWDGTSSYLVRGAEPPGDGVSGAQAPPGQQAAAELPLVDPPRGSASPPVPSTALWRLPADLGRDYASVSGDVNPIHLNSLAARAFGFPRAIAHGMWSHARMLAALDGRLPEAYTATVEFNKPVLLPSTVGFGVRPDGPGWRCALTSRDGATAHLLGVVD